MKAALQTLTETGKPLADHDFQRMTLSTLSLLVTQQHVKTAKKAKKAVKTDKPAAPKQDSRTTLDATSTDAGTSSVRAAIDGYIETGLFNLPEGAVTVEDFVKAAKDCVYAHLKSAPGLRTDFDDWWSKFLDTHLVKQLRSSSTTARSTAACALMASTSDMKWVEGDDLTLPIDRGLTFSEMVALPRLFMRHSPISEFVAGVGIKCTPDAIKFTTSEETVRTAFGTFVKTAARPSSKPGGKSKNINVCGIVKDSASAPHSGSVDPNADTYVCQLVYKSSSHLDRFGSFLRSMTAGNSVSKVIKSLSTCEYGGWRVAGCGWGRRCLPRGLPRDPAPSPSQVSRWFRPST